MLPPTDNPRWLMASAGGYLLAVWPDKKLALAIPEEGEPDPGLAAWVLLYTLGARAGWLATPPSDEGLREAVEKLQRCMEGREV